MYLESEYMCQILGQLCSKEQRKHIHVRVCISNVYTCVRYSGNCAVNCAVKNKEGIYMCEYICKHIHVRVCISKVNTCVRYSGNCAVNCAVKNKVSRKYVSRKWIHVSICISKVNTCVRYSGNCAVNCAVKNKEGIYMCEYICVQRTYIHVSDTRWLSKRRKKKIYTCVSIYVCTYMYRESIYILYVYIYTILYARARCGCEDCVGVGHTPRTQTEWAMAHELRPSRAHTYTVVRE